MPSAAGHRASPAVAGEPMSAGEVIVNGRPVPLAGVPLHVNALEFLRAHGLTGAKEGCAEGECGACAVLVARPGVSTPTTWVALDACLIPAVGLSGQEVVTVEGLGGVGALHPVQRELADRGGSQCGYCTPGFVCSMAAEYYRPGRASAQADRVGGQPGLGANGFDLDSISGTLCRCTGYRPIRDAAFALGVPERDDPLAVRRDRPPPAATPFRAQLPGADFVRPADLAEALALLDERPDAVVVAGGTDWGVEVNLRGARARLVVAIDQLPELRQIEVDDSGFLIGAALSLTEVEQRLDGAVPLLSALMPRFGSRLIRNAATLGGNLATASPIGDAAPVLLALDAQIVLARAGGDRVLPLEEFFTGHRSTVLRPGELIRAVRVPLPLPGRTGLEKVTKRRVDDISSVAAAFGLDVVDGRVRRARIGLGGVAPTPIRARDAERALEGRPWDAATVQAAAAVLAAEGTPLDDHRASAAYRRAMLAQSLLRLHADSPDGRGAR